MELNKDNSNLIKLRKIIKSLDVKEANNSEIDKMYFDYKRHSLDGYWSWDIEAEVKYFSPSLKAQLGYSDDEIPNEDGAITAHMYDEDLNELLKLMDEHFTSKGKVQFKRVVRYNHKDGSEVKILCRGHVTKWDGNGEPLRMVGSHVNVTDI